MRNTGHGSGELEALYPFLHGKQHDPAALDSALVHSVEEKARDSRETNARFFAAEADILVAAAKALADVYRRGGRHVLHGQRRLELRRLACRGRIRPSRSPPDDRRSRRSIWSPISR